MRMIRWACWATFGIVGDEDDGDALGAVELLEHLEDFLAGAGIEVAGRLVGEEHPRPVDQRSGDGHALLLAAGKLRRLVVDAVRQADLLEHLGCALSLLLLGEVLLGIGQRHQDVLQRRRARQQVEALEDETDYPVAQPGPLLGGEPGYLPAVQPVLAGSRVVQATEDVHQRAFAGAARAHQRTSSPASNVQRHAFEHGQVHLAEVVGLVNVSQFD